MCSEGDDRPCRPRKIILLMNLVGVGVGKQTPATIIFFILSTTSMLVILLTNFGSIDKGPSLTISNLLGCTVMFVARVSLVSKHKSLANLIEEISHNLSHSSLRKLAAFEIGSAVLVIIHLLIEIANDYYKGSATEPRRIAVFFDSSGVNIYIVRVVNSIFSIIILTEWTTCKIVASMYIWMFYAIYLLKCEESERLANQIGDHKRAFVTRLIQLDDKQQRFESVFAIQLLFISSLTFLLAIHHLNLLIAFKWDPNVFENIHRLYAIATDIGLFVAMVTFISHCQHKLEARADRLVCYLCAEETLLSNRCNVLLAQAINSVYRRPVTIWRMIDVSRGLILAMSSSFIGISVLIIQVDNGSLENNSS